MTDAQGNALINGRFYTYPPVPDSRYKYLGPDEESHQMQIFLLYNHVGGREQTIELSVNSDFFSRLIPVQYEPSPETLHMIPTGGKSRQTCRGRQRSKTGRKRRQKNRRKGTKK